MAPSVPEGGTTMAVDPVCKMTVEPAKAAAQSSYKGQAYYFCAVGCKQKFDREPEKYLAGGKGRVAEAVGNGAGAAFVVDAAIEVARLARQVAKLPRDQAERAASGDALDCWELDTTGWIDLPDSCFTYSAAGRSLFGTRPIATPMQPDLYSPRRGQQRVFVRRKVARLTSLDGRLVLFHSMHDNVHGFEITYELDAATGRVLRAEHVTPKLPYMGICSEPQRRINTLVGEIADDGLRKRLGPLIGGASGCAQLYDLTADVLKLLAP